MLIIPFIGFSAALAGTSYELGTYHDHLIYPILVVLFSIALLFTSLIPWGMQLHYHLFNRRAEIEVPAWTREEHRWDTLNQMWVDCAWWHLGKAHQKISNMEDWPLKEQAKELFDANFDMAVGKYYMNDIAGADYRLFFDRIALIDEISERISIKPPKKENDIEQAKRMLKEHDTIVKELESGQSALLSDVRGELRSS
jgi:hypothetical protein